VRKTSLLGVCHRVSAVSAVSALSALNPVAVLPGTRGNAM
jgi:hypothetical protein